MQSSVGVSNIDPVVVTGVTALITAVVTAIITLLGKIIVDRKKVDLTAYEKLFVNFQSEIERLNKALDIKGVQIAKLEVDFDRSRLHERECTMALSDMQNQINEIELRARPAFISCNELGIITSWDEHSTRLFGWTKDEAVGQLTTIIVPPETMGRHEAAFFKAAADPAYGGMSVRTVEAINRKGHRFTVTISVSKRDNPAGPGAIFTAELHKR